MKRIEFIAPVEAMRGNLSGKQDLRYAENDNKAYDGPLGSVNYARNYSPRFVGAKIAKNGKKYFTVRTKSASHLTKRAKKAMALLGGTGALYAAIVKNKSSQLYQQLYAQWLRFVDMGSTNNFRQSLSGAIREALAASDSLVTYAGPNGVIQFKNPWYDGSQTTDARVSQSILTKFWTMLAPQPAAVGYFENMPILAKYRATSLGQIAQNNNLNISDLVEVEALDPDNPAGPHITDAYTLESLIQTIEGVRYAPLMMLNGEYCNYDTEVIDGVTFVASKTTSLVD